MGIRLGDYYAVLVNWDLKGIQGMRVACGGYTARLLLPVQKTLITYITVIPPAPNVLVAYVFGTGLLH